MTINKISMQWLCTTCTIWNIYKQLCSAKESHTFSLYLFAITTGDANMHRYCSTCIPSYYFEYMPTVLPCSATESHTLFGISHINYTVLRHRIHSPLVYLHSMQAMLTCISTVAHAFSLLLFGISTSSASMQCYRITYIPIYLLVISRCST
jgi:hypothetical protein